MALIIHLAWDPPWALGAAQEMAERPKKKKNEDMVYIHNGIPLSHKKKKIMPFAASWMELENIILSEMSQKDKDKYHMLSQTMLFSSCTDSSTCRHLSHHSRKYFLLYCLLITKMIMKVMMTMMEMMTLITIS